MLDKFGKKYPKYTFIRTSVNNWKKKIEKDKNYNNVTLHKRKDDEFLGKVKDWSTYGWRGDF